MSLKREKHLSIELLMMVIMADESLDKREKIILDTVARDLNIETAFYEQLKANILHAVSRDILGIKTNATLDEIKKAYKNL